MRYILDREITLLFTSEGSDRNPDDDLQFMSDGVIELQITPERHNIRVAKFRGSGFVKGMIDRGTLSIMKVEPLKYTPNQFVHLVRTEVEKNKAKIC